MDRDDDDPKLRHYKAVVSATIAALGVDISKLERDKSSGVKKKVSKQADQTEGSNEAEEPAAIHASCYSISDEERESRMAKMREYRRQRRENETPEKREARLQKRRIYNQKKAQQMKEV